MNKLITNQTPYYTLQLESMLSFPNQELIEELKLLQTDLMQNQLITKVAAKASLMHKSQLTETITDEIVETHKIIRIEPHLKYLIVDIENTTNDKTFPVKVDIPTPLVQNKEGEAHEYVDLGLPSHTLWATMNVGATSETDYGNYYMYGMGNKTYDNNDTPYAGTEDPLDSSVDTASQVWGGSWHMPTRAQMEELTANTTYEWATINGVDGEKFTATNGNYVFFPAAGYCSNGSQGNVGNLGGYWGSSPNGSNNAYYLYFTNGNKGVGSYTRNGGYSVRPVIG